MKRQVRKSIEKYADRRLSLSGMGQVVGAFPFNRPMEDLGVARLAPGGTIASFAHYDYLDLAGDRRVVAATMAAAEEVGVGAGASRLVGGERAVHRALEGELAAFLGVDDVLALVSGYGTNVGLVGHVMTKDDLIIVDEADHNSILVGAELARADCVSFRHNDLEHLETILSESRSRYTRVLVVVEGLYSMDGDVIDLPRLLPLCRRYDAWLMIDEAHSIGVLGATGRGITEHFSIPASEIDLITGTFSKSFVSCGGFIAARRPVVDWLRMTLPSFVFSVGIPPPMAATALAALDVLIREPDRLVRLRDNSRYFLTSARAKGFDTGDAFGAAIVPIHCADVDDTIAAAGAALDGGYFVPPIGQIAVKRSKPRLRFFITAGHTRTALTGVLEPLMNWARLAEPH
jgi:7-keto-8-aminopelargonate synthetase-like enzyme